MDRWQGVGAADNAEWCDLVVRSHGGQGIFAHDAWTSPTRTPPLFPKCVTLIPSPLVPDLLSRIDASSGCTIKDSFASLDLAPEGFSVLLHAQWITSPALPDQAWNVPPDWTRVTDPDGLALWEEAWCHDDRPRGLFLRALLSRGIVAVLGRIEKDRVVAGGIVSRGTRRRNLQRLCRGRTWIRDVVLSGAVCSGMLSESAACRLRERWGTNPRSEQWLQDRRSTAGLDRQLLIAG